MSRAKSKYDDAVGAALEVIERRRTGSRVSQRAAADWAGMSEATWRQLVARGVMQRGEWVARHPRRDQLLYMAAAVGELGTVAEIVDATPDEVAEAQRNVHVPTAAEQDILENRHLTLDEKAQLIRLLGELRSGGGA